MLPRHVAVIPDGNRRWAKARLLPSFMGHQKGAEMIEKILEHSLQLGIECFTFWGCSVTNVTERDPKEVAFLYTLFERYFTKLLKAKVLHEHQVRVRMLGAWPRYFPESCQAVMRELEGVTQKYNKHHLTFLLAYSGYDEMLIAAGALAEERSKNSDFVIDAESLKQRLLTRDLPVVDLVVRTGGEPHWSSGFMMWDTGDALLYFTEKPWPAFTPAQFDKALAFYGATERRKGK